MSRRIPVIHNWSVCEHGMDRFRAPELGIRYRIAGDVIGHPTDGDGPITTGTIRGFARGVISTSRSRYRLRTVDPDYVKSLCDKGLHPDPLRQVRFAVQSAKKFDATGNE